MYTDLTTRRLWYDGDSTISHTFLNDIDNISNFHQLLELGKLKVDKITPNIEQYNNMVDSKHQIDVKTHLSILDNQWILPDFYKTIDLSQHLMVALEKQYKQENWSFRELTCRAKRIIYELKEFQRTGGINVLRTLIYLVNTFKENNIIWGVGRGSSVASYVLYLIGVHDVDSITYDLDFSEFMHE